MPVTRDLPALALLAPDDGTLAGAFMAADRLVVSTGLLVLPGGAGSLAAAGLPTPAWRLTRMLDATLLHQTLRTRCGAPWAARVRLLLVLALLRVCAERQEAGMRTSGWV